MSLRNKRLIKCVSFLLLLVFFIGVLSWLIGDVQLEYNGKRKGYSRGIYGEAENTVDVFFMGDSENFCAFSPMEIWEKYGITSHCVGHYGESVQLMYEHFYNLVDLQTPDVIFLETNSIFQKTSLEETLRTELRMHVPAIDNHDIWRRATLDDLRTNHYWIPIDDMKGYLYFPDVIPWEKGEYMFPTEEKEQLTIYARIALDAIVKECRDRGIELILITVPSPLCASQEKHNTIQKYADENELVYLDLNFLREEIGIDLTKHTFDGGDHLNYEGAVRVSDYIGNWLQENYDLTDHRSDEIYREWNISLENYKKVIAGSEKSGGDCFRFAEK